MSASAAIPPITVPSVPFIEWIAPAMMAIGLILLLIIAVLLFRRGRGVPADPLRAAASAELEQLADLREELVHERQRIAELIAVAQRLAAKSDEKTSLLNQLIEQAEERVAAVRPAESPRHERIRNLVEQGFAPEEVARRVDEPGPPPEVITLPPERLPR